ncbi:DNA topoisomerase 2-binding protein 1 [Copidosoma floridanum]|uniref:DNA topoisomerase 2-binding protein 1 n=1 Tax=Copidosoma floridanum TaxID=29053 RepID=UPI0006C9BE74|nr:DNA topoisomerase 2-binding protein 1 [Copidosoma floridanum]
MENETNQTTYDDIRLHFVLPKGCDHEDACDEEMWDLYNRCPELGIEPDWILENDCLKLKPDRKDVFVMQLFEGEIFEKLQETKCTIVGPPCLWSCFLSGEPIPDGSAPVFNTAMRNITVSASGFSVPVKNEIRKKVEYMGGIFTKQLRSSVTHLVTDIVMSAKYERAVELDIKIVTLDWVTSVWDTNLKETVLATDPVFDKFKCPVFLNLIVTSTNLNKRQKEDVKKLVNSNGGEFMGILDGTKIKIVIAVKSSTPSEKLKYAMQNNIPCLNIDWIYDSVKAGYSLPFKKYLIESTQACSTPEKNAARLPMNLSSISIIPGDNNMCVDETIASITTMSSTGLSATLSENAPTVSKENYSAVVDKLSIAEAKKAGPFLDGCNIYLTGFSSNHRDKINKILNVGSATRLDEISEALTHVIVGDPVRATADLRLIKSKGLYPFILKVEWLEECIKVQAPALEDNFFFDKKKHAQQVPLEPQSPLSKKNLQLLQRPKVPAVPLFDETNKPNEQDELSEIVQQYVTLANDSISSKNKSLSERWNALTKKPIEASLNGDNADNDSAIPVSQESYISQKIFRGLIFLISGFEDEEYTQVVAQIHGLGGKIVSQNYSGIPDYGIVPKFGAELKHTVGEIVTDLFIEDCIDNEKLLDVAYYHRPILVSKSGKPLAKCVIGMSAYCGAERTFLSKLSEALGAKYQDTFARKTNLSKNVYSSTHLVCPNPKGDKYIAAVKWRLPAVTADWLLCCAAEMKLVDENDYLVGETTAPDRTNNSINTCKNSEVENSDSKLMKPPAKPSSRSNFMNQDQFEGGTGETPIIHKRVTSLIGNKSLQSPFHVTTPETPYGQLFKENPSPRTRKAWANWIDKFPDMVEEPPLKRRCSTPMSQVKRQAWDFVTGRLNSQEQEPNENEDAPEKENNMHNGEYDGKESESSQITTNRRLSFSEDSPNRPPKNPIINMQIAQLEKMLDKASSTPEASTRQSLSAEHANPYHLESTIQGRCVVKDSQPESVGWEDPIKRIPPQRQSIINEEPIELEDENENAEASLIVEEEKPTPKFMFSGIKDRSGAEKVVLELGGEVSSESAFDPTATHLICLKPSRNEKILSSIAAGKWVLHYLYIEACKEEKTFVNEEEFELGNPKSVDIISGNHSESEKVIMRAAYRWRLKLLHEPGGAFRGMVALLISPKDKKDQFERLIKAGGGIVVEAKPPYDTSPNSRKITHCFIHMKQVDQQIEWAMMASKGILCFPPQYLNDHLMEETSLNPRECVLPEFKKYLTLMPK